MIDLRPILQVIGLLLLILAAAMLLPILVELYSEKENVESFAASAFLSAFVGGVLFIGNQGGKKGNLTLKQAFVLTTFSWLAMVLFASLPFMVTDVKLSFTDAFFESMSGLTTTGATIMTGLDTTSPGILMWRSILQWLGGIGIIVMAMALLPLLRIGGMQLFRTESSDKTDKVLPRARQIATLTGGIYLALTLICFFCLWFLGMSPFDALNHAMTAVATAGFSTKDASIGYFSSEHIEMVLMIFMVLSSLPFVLYIKLVHGGSWSIIARDTQVRYFIAILLMAILTTVIWLVSEYNLSLDRALRVASFNVISIATTTGYATRDYYAWGSFAVMIFFLLAVVGGCTGSTSGGMKVFRIQVLFGTAKVQMQQLIKPHGIFKPRYNGKTMEDSTSYSVMAFIILFGAYFSFMALMLSLTGVDYISAMSASAAMLANLGPGLGDVVGPAGNYSSLPDIAKWICASGMLVGRLEIFTVLILFTPYFWKN